MSTGRSAHRTRLLCLISLVACGSDASTRSRDPGSPSSPRSAPGTPGTPSPCAPTPEARAAECPYVTTDGPAGADAIVALIAPSIAEIYRLDLLHLEGVSHVDHPRAEPTDDGRFEIGFFATDETLAALCDRGCVASRRCEVRVVESKQALLDRWRQLQCEVERGTNDPPRAPACKTP